MPELEDRFDALVTRLTDNHSFKQKLDALEEQHAANGLYWSSIHVQEILSTLVKELQTSADAMVEAYSQLVEAAFHLKGKAPLRALREHVLERFDSLSSSWGLKAGVGTEALGVVVRFEPYEARIIDIRRNLAARLETTLDVAVAADKGKKPIYLPVFLSVILAATLTFFVTSYFKSTDREVARQTEALKEKTAVRQQLMQELLPRLEALRLPDRSTYMDAVMSDDPKPSANILKRANATLDTLNLGADLMEIKLSTAFEPAAAHQYLHIRTNALAALKGMNDWRLKARRRLEAFKKGEGGSTLEFSSSELGKFYQFNRDLTEFEHKLFSLR